MSKDNIRDHIDALIYMTECTLATVEHMMCIKSKTKSEFQRQKNIAQVGIDSFKIYINDSDKAKRCLRFFEIIKNKLTVEEWVKKHEQ